MKHWFEAVSFAKEHLKVNLHVKTVVQRRGKRVIMTGLFCATPVGMRFVLL